MYAADRIAVIIPCYRVAAFVAGVIGSLPEFVDDVIVVDDASRDARVEIVAFGEGRPGVYLVRTSEPGGRGHDDTASGTRSRAARTWW